MKKLYDNIAQFGDNRNLIKGSTPYIQYVKLAEEFGELASAIARKDRKKLVDSIGDCLVVSTIMLKQLNYLNNIADVISWEPYDKSSTDVYKVFATAANQLGNIGYRLYRGKPDSVHIDILGFIDALYDLAYFNDLTAEECLVEAYAQIKDRKGVMLGGVFIKEEDVPATLKATREEYDCVNKQILDNLESTGDIKLSELETKNLQSKALELANIISILEHSA